MRIFLVLLVAASLAVPAFAQTAQTLVPVRQERGVLFVQAMVNGKGPLLFTFDPGGTDVYTSSARTVLRADAPRTMCFSSACFPVAMDYFDSDPSEIDPKHDPSRGVIAGSIGPALLRRFVVRIDYRASTLALIPPERFQPPASAISLPLAFDSYAMPVVHAQVDGVPGVFEVDVRTVRVDARRAAQARVPYAIAPGVECVAHRNN